MGFILLVVKGWDWLYPLPLLVLLVIVLAIVGAALYQERRRPDPERVKQDLRRWEEIERVLPRQAITWVREHDFPAGFRMEETDPFYDFRAYDEVEHRFMDPDLETRRKALHAAVVEFTNAVNLHTSPAGGSSDFQTVKPQYWIADDDEYRSLMRERSTALNDAADKIVKWYDELYKLAREKFNI